MKLTGLTAAEREQFEQLRLKLRRARQAALDTATAYDEALAEVLEFVKDKSFRFDDFYASRSDKWVDKDDTPHKAAVLEFKGDWYHAVLNLAPIGFDAATRKHVEFVDNLPPKVAGQG